MIALPMLVQSIVNANSNGATIGTFDGGTNQLTTVAKLSVSGEKPETMFAQYFVPTSTGSFDIGLSSSSEDTVLVLYEGSFDPNNPGVNSVTLIDDYTGSRPTGISVSSGSCGVTDPRWKLLPPNISQSDRWENLFYSRHFIRSKHDRFRWNNLYIYGNPVLIGTSTQDGASKSLNHLLRLSAFGCDEKLSEYK